MKGTKELFCSNIRQYEKQMYALAMSILRNDYDAEDAVQDAIVKAYSRYEDLRDQSKFKSWILSIVHNTAVEFLRKNRDALDIEQQELHAEENDVDKKLTLWQSVQNLKMPYREVTALFYYGALSVQDISRITSTPAVTVRQQLFRARKMLAAQLHKEDFYP